MLRDPSHGNFCVSGAAESLCRSAVLLRARERGWQVCDTPGLFDIENRSIGVVGAAFDQLEGNMKLLFVLSPCGHGLAAEDVEIITFVMSALPTSACYSVIVNCWQDGSAEVFEKRLLENLKSVRRPSEICFIPKMMNAFEEKNNVPLLDKVCLVRANDSDFHQVIERTPIWQNLGGIGENLRLLDPQEVDFFARL
jgi:hypothetical protein